VEQNSLNRGAHNILVVSDLHLGEDLSPAATEGDTRHLELVERHLIQFLRHYSHRRLDGRPWRLVVNGDMVDFLTICVLPDDERIELAGEVPEEAKVYGLGRRVEVARAQMLAVVDRHRDVFRAIARFVAAGNAVDIICGNHDTELHWPEVQQALRDGVGRIWAQMPQSRRTGAPTAEALDASISFHPWFYHEPGSVWIEHGHQYDECCSFDFGLCPVDPTTGEIVSNVDAASLRYVSNQISEVEAHGTEEWTLGGYVRFAFGLGLRGTWRLFRSYCRFAATLVRGWRRNAIWTRAHGKRQELHTERLRQLAERSSVSLGSLESVDRMRRRPVVANLWRLMNVLMLDRLVLLAVSVLLVLVALAALPLSAALPVGAGVLGGAWWLQYRAGHGRSLDNSLPLQLMPARILEHVDARFVVFGHTHEPVAQPLDGGRMYFNTGTWLPAGRPGLLRSFTHVIVRHTERGPVAALCQWRDGASRDFTPGWVPVAATVAAPAAAPVVAPAPAPVAARSATPSAEIQAA
jgi:UDP-2,3-diacylglucosamine pyrophosphatase LpxH